MIFLFSVSTVFYRRRRKSSTSSGGRGGEGQGGGEGGGGGQGQTPSPRRRANSGRSFLMSSIPKNWQVQLQICKFLPFIIKNNRQKRVKIYIMANFLIQTRPVYILIDWQ